LPARQKAPGAICRPLRRSRSAFKEICRSCHADSRRLASRELIKQRKLQSPHQRRIFVLAPGKMSRRRKLLHAGFFRMPKIPNGT